jgi:hypothetical protein
VAVIEGYAGVMLAILLAMVLLYVFQRRKTGFRKPYTISNEAAAEMECVLGNYRRLAAAFRERIADAGQLPEPKETIKLYLQIAIGLARMNGQPADALLEEYYLLAHFQAVDEGDEGRFPLAVDGAEGAQEGDGQADVSDAERKYGRRVAAEGSALQRELEAFLKRKRFF